MNGPIGDKQRLLHIVEKLLDSEHELDFLLRLEKNELERLVVAIVRQAPSTTLCFPPLGEEQPPQSRLLRQTPKRDLRLFLLTLFGEDESIFTIMIIGAELTGGRK
jgi:hypothetical protein